MKKYCLKQDKTAASKKRRTSRAALAILLSLSMVMSISGCGGKKENVPDLLDPISTNAAYRPVMKGDIGNKIVKTGNVVPEDYCYYFKTSSELEKLNVAIGQYVHKGDVLAEASAEAGESEVTELENNLAEQRKNHELNQKIFQQNQKIYDYQIKGYEETGDEESLKAARIQKATAIENDRYDGMLYDYQIRKAEEEIEEKKKLIGSNRLVAEVDGYVTYVKDTTESSTVGANENVVVVSDYNKTHIEIPDLTVKDLEVYQKYGIKYAVIDGEKHDLKIDEYSKTELAKAQAMSQYPNMRFELADGETSKLKTGDMIPMYFSSSDISNVLMIGNDSIYEDGEQAFVYVKTENSDKERRDVELGAADTNNTQVLSGLDEGDLVFYASDAIMPGNYSEYKVELKDFSISKDSKKLQLVDTDMVKYKSPCEGYLVDFNLQAGMQVSKGDILYSIDSGGGSAELKQAALDIQHAKEEYNSNMNGYNDQINDYKKQIEDYKYRKAHPADPDPEDPPVATDTDPDKPDDPDTPDDNQDTPYFVEQTLCQIEIVNINKQIATNQYNSNMKTLQAKYDELAKDNDGTGVVKVYAEQDGYIVNVYATKGYKLEKGTDVVGIASKQNQILGAAVEGKLAVNQQVTLVNSTDNSNAINARCIGNSGDGGKVYINTVDGEVQISTCAASGSLLYYLAVDDQSYYDTPKGYVLRYSTTDLKNVVVLPKGMIYTETVKTTGSTKKYVWKVIDGQIVKQYVTLGEEDSKSVCVLSGVDAGDILALEKAN